MADVLLAGRSALNRFKVSRALSRRGHRTHGVRNGAEVLEALDSLGNDTEAQHLRETLRHARSQGVLVDLGEEPRRKPNARPKPGVQAAPSGAERAQSAV